MSHCLPPSHPGVRRRVQCPWRCLSKWLWEMGLLYNTVIHSACGGGSLSWLNPLVPCLVFTPGIIQYLSRSEIPTILKTTLQMLIPSRAHSALFSLGGIMVSLSNFIITEPIHIVLIHIVQFVSIHSVFILQSYTWHKLPVPPQIQCFCLFTALYVTSWC